MGAILSPCPLPRQDEQLQGGRVVGKNSQGTTPLAASPGGRGKAEPTQARCFCVLHQSEISWLPPLLLLSPVTFPCLGCFPAVLPPPARARGQPPGLWATLSHRAPGQAAAVEAARGVKEATRLGLEVGVGSRSDLLCSADLEHRTPRPRSVGSLMGVAARLAPARLREEAHRLRRPSVGPRRRPLQALFLVQPPKNSPFRLSSASSCPSWMMRSGKELASFRPALRARKFFLPDR